MPQVVRDREMGVSSSVLYKAITDFARYPEFLSEVVGARMEPGGDPNRCQVTFEIEVVKRFEYVLDFTLKPEEEVSWRLVKSNFFKNNDGKWVLKPLEGKRTQVHYELEIGFGFLVPGWISKKLTEVNLPRMLDSFEARAQSLQAKA